MAQKADAIIIDVLDCFPFFIWLHNLASRPSVSWLCTAYLGEEACLLAAEGNGSVAACSK